MKQETNFDPAGELIIVEAMIWGPRGQLPVTLALDTGSAATLVVPDMLDAVGYSPRDGKAITRVRTAVSEEHGYTLHLTQFSALGFTIPDVPIHVFDLANGYGINGLVGLSFLRRFNYEIHSGEGRILVEKIAP